MSELHPLKPKLNKAIMTKYAYSWPKLNIQKGSILSN